MTNWKKIPGPDEFVPNVTSSTRTLHYDRSSERQRARCCRAQVLIASLKDSIHSHTAASTEPSIESLYSNLLKLIGDIGWIFRRKESCHPSALDPLSSLSKFLICQPSHVTLAELYEKICQYSLAEEELVKAVRIALRCLHYDNEDAKGVRAKLERVQQGIARRKPSVGSMLCRRFVY